MTRAVGLQPEQELQQQHRRPGRPRLRPRRGRILDREGRLGARQSREHLRELVVEVARHRLAMALAVASLVAEGETTVAAADSVAISYPNFWQQLAGLAA